MKNLLFICICLLFLGFNSFAQTDSTITEKEPIHFYEVDLMTRNVWRGVDFGNLNPSCLALIGISPVEGLEIGTFSIFNLFGNRLGYGNSMNIYTSYEYKNFKLTLDDYYFQGHSSNIETNYLDWKNTHFLEARLEYSVRNFNLLTSYTLFGGDLYNINTSTFNNTQAFYCELSYENDFVGLSVGGITAPSALNFHDKAGITNIKVKYMNMLKSLPFETGIVYNPNYDNIAPLDLPRFGYGLNQFNYYLILIID